MSDTTKIQWADHTKSPWHGCTHGTYTDADGNEHEHPGCLKCYAEKGAKRNPGTLGVWGTDGTRVISASFHRECIRWNAAAERDGVIRSVFPSICDPFEDWQGPIFNAKGRQLFCDGDEYFSPGKNSFAMSKAATMNDLRRDLFATIDSCPHLRFLLLTKRPGNVRRMWPTFLKGWNPKTDRLVAHPNTMAKFCSRPNVAVLTSISDQATADAMIPPLLACRDLSPILGVSYEPAIGPVDFRRIGKTTRGDDIDALRGTRTTYRYKGRNDSEGSMGVACQVHPPTEPVIDWIIIGGESGHGARPFIMDWGAAVIIQCRDAGVPVFMKQVGSNPMIRDGIPACGITTSVWGPIKDPKGGVMEEWPAHLRVRQMPKALVRS